MKRFLVRVATGVAVVVAGTSMVTGAAWAGSSGLPTPTATPGPVVRALPSGHQVCRWGVVRPVPGLAARANLCVRFEHGAWVGSGDLVLVADRAEAVSGSYSFGPSFYPVRPSGYVGGGTFSLKAGQSVTYPLGGQSVADPSDTGADWEVWVGVPNGDRAIGLEGELKSPVGSRTPSVDRPSRFVGTTRWTCTAKRVSGQTLSGVATLCARQVGGLLESSASLTYRSATTVDVQVGLAVDGLVATTQNSVAVPASPRARRTVTLPRSIAQARTADHRAATFVRIDATPVLSNAITVR